MKILVAGATGATGRLLVEHLLNRGHIVKVIIRSPEKLPAIMKNHDRLIVIHAGILDLGEAEIAWHVKDCDAVASCLGHTLNLKGIYGQPRGLVADAVRLLCNGIQSNIPDRPVRFVLMNTTANCNRDLQEQLSAIERGVIGLVRLLLPPQIDNEKAAEHLRVSVGHGDRFIEWVVVRPDTLINDKNVSEYEVYASPTRSPIFNAGKTSRINVAHFMADLITDEKIWNRWKGQMPVIYNTTDR
jgi:nucleoside-diphosphate-sugar epimerase